MLGLFSKVTPYITKKKKNGVPHPRPDNTVFKLHYKVTFAILLISCILVSSYNYIDSSGSSIQCLFDAGTKIPARVINQYCWIMSTFTLPKHYNGIPGEDMLHFGVGPHKEEDERVYHSYYQWVPLVLSIQAIFFYAPHWIWKQLEGGRLEKIISGLDQKIYDDSDRKQKVDRLSDYMSIRVRETREHHAWARKFFFCECLNFINVVIQIVAMDKFLGGEFSNYGMEVLNFPDMEPEDRIDPMSRIFPKMTKCIFHKYGGSGTIQRFDALCVLSMNIVNEKIYIFLWFWFIILAVITGINLIVRMASFFLPNVRQRVTELESLGYIGRSVNKQNIHAMVERLAYSDWLILYYLAQAMEKANFGALLTNLVDEIPLFVSESDEQDIEEKEGKSITPPPEFEEVDKNSGSRTTTLKSPSKLKSVLSFRKEKP